MKLRESTGAALALLLGMVTLAVGCATPVGVREVPRQAAHRVLTANAISRSEASLASRTVLLRLGLLERFERNPEGALRALHEWTLEKTLERFHPDDLFALAELSFLYAEARERRCGIGFVARRDPRFPASQQRRSGCPSPAPYYLAAAVYAYAFMFLDETDAPRSIVDPRNRVAVDLYNLALASVLDTSTGSLVVPPELSTFHLGSLEVETAEGAFSWGEREVGDFVSANELDVRGLRNRYRTAGVGAPYVATVSRRKGVALSPSSARVMDGVKHPVTAFLRFEDLGGGLRRGALQGRLEVTPTAGEARVEVEGMRLPLEADPTAALASGLDQSSFWDYEIAGFRRGDLPTEPGLFLMYPYRKGRIPVVFVHGTASSPARWAEMLNELQADPAIRDAYQAWFFVYSSGNPILYSADVLRRSLRETMADLDPEGRDPALRRMILIGHSQGGLLARLQVTDSGDRFWSNQLDTPFEEVELAPETRELLASTIFFEPQPFVGRVVFLATPHRGSFMARGRLGRLASWLFHAPEELLGVGLELAWATVDLVGDAFERDEDQEGGRDDAELQRRLARIPSSVDNMRPDHVFTRTLQALPIADGVYVHSVIPVRGAKPPEGQDDGVVAFESAHLEEADSERVIFHAGHSVQSHPEAILEVRRILREHLRSLAAEAAKAP
jgi:pimeloyl-ACP methyl ester carboxylesterase